MPQPNVASWTEGFLFTARRCANDVASTALHINLLLLSILVACVVFLPLVSQLEGRLVAAPQSALAGTRSRFDPPEVLVSVDRRPPAANTDGLAVQNGNRDSQWKCVACKATHLDGVAHAWTQVNRLRILQHK